MILGTSPCVDGLTSDRAPGPVLNVSNHQKTKELKPGFYHCQATTSDDLNLVEVSQAS
jgi:hypothetical protein